MNRPVTLTTTLTLEDKLRLKYVSALLNRNQGQVIADALRVFVEHELTGQQRNAVDEMIRHSNLDREAAAADL
jgi:hypothetical protein